MKSIQFFSEETPFVLKNKNKIREWIRHSIRTEGYQVGELSYIFCSDEYLLKINQEYLNHQTYTDIITFDNSESEDIISGDIFISIERVRENAKKFEVSSDEELRRVMIHGIMHLCGYPDKSLTEKARMREKENQYITKYQ